MKRIVRLTESDLTRIVRRIIKESESKPKKIEIEFLPNWEDKLMQMKDDDGDRGHTPYGSGVELYDNGEGIKIGYGPYVMRDNSRVFFYANYKPQFNEIQVSGLRCFGYDAIQEAEDSDYLPVHLTKDDLRPQEDLDKQDKTKRNYCQGGVGDFYSKFDSFEVGETDHRDYFEIVSVDDEHQPKEEEQLFERYYRKRR